APLLDRLGLLAAPEEVERRAIGVKGEIVALGDRLIEFLDLFEPFFRRQLVAAGRAQNAVDDLVIRSILGDALAEPFMPHLAALRLGLDRLLERLRIVARDIGKLGGP